MGLWGNNIFKIQVCNFPYIGNKTIDFSTNDYDNSFRLGDERYYSSVFLTSETNVKINPYELIFLFICNINSPDLNELFKLFCEEKETIIIIDYLDQGFIYHYKIEFNKYGIIKETLHEIKDGLYSQVFNSNIENNIHTSLPFENIIWFDNIALYSYLEYDDIINEKRNVYNDYLTTHLKNLKEWDDYEAALVDLLNIQTKYKIDDIKIFQTGQVYIYEVGSVSPVKLEDYSEHFINYFLLLAVVLRTLSLSQGILILTECDKLSDIILISVFRMFNQQENNDLGSQLIFIGSNELQLKLGLNKKQIYSYNLK